MANYTFVNAYAVNSATTVAGKEQNSVDFNITGLGSAVITDGSGGANFSGNDVVVRLTIGGVDHYGWISRPIKSGGQVKGFYFWKDPSFNNLSDATSDGNRDTDGNDVDNAGFVLVVEQAYFDGLSLKSGSTTLKTVGSSSDRVDASLNSVLPVNSAPVGVNDSGTVLEDGSVSGNVLSNDTDADGNTLTVTGFTIAGVSGTQSTGQDIPITGVGTVRINSNGSYTFTPETDYAGPVPALTYTLSDGNGGTGSASLSLSITAVNDAPSAANDLKAVTEGVTTTGNVLSNDSDIDGGNLSVSAFSVAGGTAPYTVGSPYTMSGVGTFTLNANGSYTFAPVTGFAGAVPVVTYTVSDSLGGTAQATLTFTLSAVNDAPVAAADNAGGAVYAVEAGCNQAGSSQSAAAPGVLGNDTDADGNTLTVTGVSSDWTNQSDTNATGGFSVTGRYGTLVLQSVGSYEYTPNDALAAVQALNPGQTLSETFTYTISDGAGGTSQSTLTAVIRGTNDAPVATNDVDSLQETTSSVVGGVTIYGATSGNVLTNDTDVDAGDALTVSGSSATAVGATLGGTTTSTLSLDNINTWASLDNTFYVYADSGSHNGTTYTNSASAPTLLYLNGVAVKVSSTSGSGSNKTVTLNGSSNYTDVNGNPLTLSQNSVIGFDKLANSTGEDAGSNKYYLGFLKNSPTTTTTTTNQVSISSVSAGAISVGMTITGTTAAGAVFTRTVTEVNYDTTSGDPQSVTFDGAALSISSSTLSFSASAGTTLTGKYGTLTFSADGSYTYRLTSSALTDNQTYTERFAYTATDGDCSSNAVLYVRLNGTTSEVMVDDTVNVPEDAAPYSSSAVGAYGSVLTNDTRTNTIASFTWGGSSQTAGSSITLAGIGELTIHADGNFVFTPEANYTGAVPSATYILATSGSSANLHISITPSNDAPTSGNDSIRTAEDSAYTLTLNDFGSYADAEGSALSDIQIITLPLKGTLLYDGNPVVLVVQDTFAVADIASGRLSYAPAANENGDAYTSLTFKVKDGATFSTSAYNLVIDVTPVNDAPVNTVPGAQTLNSTPTTAFSTSLALSAGTGNLVSVSDVDENLSTVTLSVSYGTLALTVPGAGAGSAVTVSGDGTSSVTLSTVGGTHGSTAADLNAVLSSLVYTASTGFSGGDQLRVMTTDSGGLTDLDAFNITVNADDRPLDVVGSTVNEASPYVMFSVTGASGQQVKLVLTGVTATSALDYVPTLEYYDAGATTWVAYTANTYFALPASTTFVRVPVLQDTADEGVETFTLTAFNQAGNSTNSGGAAVNPGTGTLRDDGAGNIYLGSANSLTPSQTGDSGYPAKLDDDRALTVRDPNNSDVNDPLIGRVLVNEASQWAVLKVSGQANQEFQLTLTNGTAADADHGLISANEVEVLVSGAWTTYSAGAWITLPVSGSTLVRVAIKDDSVFEGAESFGVVAANTGGRSATGTVVIMDDGTGSVFDPNAIDGSLASPTPTLDDDRTITVTGYGPVNEGSTWAMFQVVASQGAPIGLDVAGSGITQATTTFFTLEYSTNGSSWSAYSANSPPLIPGSLGGGTGTLYVRVNITSENNNIYEVSKTFSLTGTVVTGMTPEPASSAETAIVDDGTGTRYTGDFSSGTPATNSSGSNDNDSVASLTVSSPTVNEGSSHAVFSVGLTSGQNVSLALANGSSTPATGGNTTPTDGSVDYGNNTLLQYSLDNGTTWSNYSAAFNATLSNGATALLVRTTVVNDTVVDNNETFTLTVTPTGGTAVVGTATIKDDGTGDIFDANDGSVDTGATKNDDTLAPPPPLSADLDPATDTGEYDRITQNIEPEFTINAGDLLIDGGSARLLDPEGNVISTSPVTQSDIDRGSINIAPGLLDDGTYTFISQILDAQGNVLGALPVVVTVVTDRDGVMPSVELAANNGDFNSDGIADWLQNNVAQFPVLSHTDYLMGKNAPSTSFGAVMGGRPDPQSPLGVMLDASVQLVNVRIDPLPATPVPQGFAALTDLVHFTVEAQVGGQLSDIDPIRDGLQTQVILDLPSGVQSNAYLKYNAITQSWVDFTNASAVHGTEDGAALLDTNDDGLIDRIVITLTDGGPGDEDGIVNGTIVDPGALAFRPGIPIYYNALPASEDRTLSTRASTENPDANIQFYAAAQNGPDTVPLKAWINTITGDWFYGRADVTAPYDCYVERPDVVLGHVLMKDQGAFNVYTYLNPQGITQIMSREAAQALELLSKGYLELGDAYVFASEQAVPVTLAGTSSNSPTGLLEA